MNIQYIAVPPIGRNFDRKYLPSIFFKFTLKGQSHEKVGEMSVWGISLGPN
jgi:hypothetical protein